jgi:hypothetical protein
MTPELSALRFPDFITSPEFAFSHVAIQTNQARGTMAIHVRPSPVAPLA